MALKERAERANDIKYNHEDSLSETFADKDETDTRKLAAEHMHVSEWKVREVQEMEKKSGYILWQSPETRASINL